MTTRDSTTQLLDQARKKRAPPIAPKGGPPRGGLRSRRPRGRPMGRGRGGRSRGRSTRGRGRNSVRGRIRGLRRGGMKRSSRPSIAPPRPNSEPKIKPSPGPKEVNAAEPEPTTPSSPFKNKFPPKIPSRPGGRRPGVGSQGNRSFPPKKPARHGRPSVAGRSSGRVGMVGMKSGPSVGNRKAMFEKKAQQHPGGFRKPGGVRPGGVRPPVREEKKVNNRKPQPQVQIKSEPMKEESLAEEPLEEEVLDEETAPVEPPQRFEEKKPVHRQIQPTPVVRPQVVEKEEVEGEEEQASQPVSAGPPSSGRSSGGGNSSGGGGEEVKKKPIFSRRKEEQTFTDELKEAFFIFDLNGDGSIEKSLMYEMLEEVQHDRHQEIVREIESVPKVDFPFFEQLMKKYLALPFTSEDLNGMFKELEPVNGSFEFDDFKRALEEANGGGLEPEMIELLEGLSSDNKLSTETMVREMGSRL